MINYEGRRFRNPEADDGVVARYHQSGDLVWAHFSGGKVRRGSVNGVVDSSGVLKLAYTMVLADNEIITGFTHTTPEHTDDGVLRLREEWQRYGPNGSAGVSYLEEVR
ncbi:hypothetical protein NDR87_12925 [Nocardia sp. CDC159]|uniref:Uncharacterized protein n=1 Tax=Nocardia pulmonis TaxID=2951408 RepID=A0A9X2E5M9_9NOCA|nr:MULTISPECIES: hypothetical protein [Nocardia]MCM6774674.1 hypothetical protein [Nocardia pulmonis]MCM6787261.1 hypothetical protein [Nocardia sp. CDC159]